MAIDGLAGLARKLADELDDGMAGEGIVLYDYALEIAERVLRESKLPELLAAGQAMHHCVRSYEYGNASPDLAIEATARYRAALAAFLAATEGEKGV